MDDPRGLIPYIRDTAVKYGIDPDTAVRVAGSEGLSNPIGDKGKSFGAFQLYTGGGLGNEFQKAGGDISDERATIDYALQRASQGGWGPWNGAKRVGIGQWDGIRAPQGTTQVNVPVPFNGAAPSLTAGLPVPPQQQQQPQQLPPQASAEGGASNPFQPPQPLTPILQQFRAYRPQVNMAPLQALLNSLPPSLLTGNNLKGLI